ncbi:MAG: NADP-dependent phosphogluconate dehydrogenase [Erysipelotrichaceae bacterium]
MKKQQIGIVGMGVMGAAIAQNFARQEWRVAIYNRSLAKATQVATKDPEHLQAYSTLSALAQALTSPRVILLMVNAGEVVDEVIERLLPELEAGDIIIDGGNSHYEDSERRFLSLKEQGISFLGMGVSGGEQGALLGPSMMVGGSKQAYEQVAGMLASVASQVNQSACVGYFGTGGSGHFLKMVHNGIEYAMMQLIAECYTILSQYTKQSPQACVTWFQRCNSGLMASYLLDISEQIIGFKELDGSSRLEHIGGFVDQKGTGKWSVLAGVNLKSDVSLLATALQARNRTSLQNGVETKVTKMLDVSVLEQLQAAYTAATLLIYKQGFDLLEQAKQTYGYTYSLAEIGRIFQGGCIIQGALMQTLAQAGNDSLTAFMQEPNIQSAFETAYPALKAIVLASMEQDCSLPLLQGCYLYVLQDNDRMLQTNLIAAQRDLFGAHTIVDKASGQRIHLEWEQ